MYSHPSLVQVQAQVFAPSRCYFWAWWKANVVQGDLFGFEEVGRSEDGGFVVPARLAESIRNVSQECFAPAELSTGDEFGLVTLVRSLTN